MTGTILSILMLAGLALTGGGIFTMVRRRERKRGMLMIAAGLVMFANVAIAVIPYG
ncbi:LPXTG cell wall anchor domain-containing protein [Sphingobium sp. AN558]|uniref:LPXTG cell wall anchor domain-containing protein n=1 Tax=Sphingobium sp. AN558 TaxID=3133442 RepID=UPI0030BCE6EC